MNKFQYYETMKQKLEANAFKVEKHTEIDYGLQFLVTLGSQTGLIRIYDGKKGVRHDFSQVKDKDLVVKIESWLNSTPDNAESDISPDPQELCTVCQLTLPQTLILNSEEEKNEITDFLSGIGAAFKNTTLSHIDAIYNINGLAITFFKSGKILFQGKPSPKAQDVYDKIVQLVRNEHRKEFYEQVEKYFVDSTDLTKYIEETSSMEAINSPGEEFLGHDLFNYLHVNDQIDLLDALQFYQHVKKEQITFKNYVILVRNFAIVFEGFLIKLFLHTNIITEADYAGDPNVALGTKLADNSILNFIKNSGHNKYIAVELESVWQSHRNKTLHSDYLAHKTIATFEEAEHDIHRIGKVMKDCYQFLDFDKINVACFGQRSDHSSIDIYGIDIEKVLVKLISEESFQLKQQSHAKWVAYKGSVNIINIADEFLKIIGPKDQITKYRELLSTKEVNDPDELIGTDESGKGDYFGPIVIAGVYVNSSIASELRKIGVQDSKKLSDAQIILLAQKIKKICPFYSVVSIGNEKYNELYEKMKNLNTILGWGHARAIENVLEKVECKDALSDQFGDQKIIESALLKKGKTIRLRQRPKAEENIAVAAASILARNEFILKLEKMSTDYKLTFPKGASSQVIAAAKVFIEKYNKDELEKVAKLHFKTTGQL